MASLNNFNISSAQNQDILIYSNGEWVNSSINGFFGVLDGRYSINTHNHNGEYMPVGTAYTKAETYPAASLYTRAEIDALVSGGSTGGTGGGTVDGATNIGTGTSIFSSNVAGILQFRKITSSNLDLLTLSVSGDTVVLNPQNPSWGDITGKPATATRWPTKAEVGLGNVQDRAFKWAWGTGTPTHIWASAGDSTNQFVYTPNEVRDAMDIRWSDVTGKPSVAATNSANVTFDGGTNTTLTIKSNDSGESELNLYGDSQGTGRVYVGQSSDYGGGFEYNGDGAPSSVGGNDDINFFRRNNGINHLVMSYRYSSNTVSFTATPQVNGNDVYHTANKQDHIPSLGVKNVPTGRTTYGSGVFTYNTRNANTGQPEASYGSSLTWGDGDSGAVEMWSGWTSGQWGELWIRGLRDTTDNWTSWYRVYTDKLGVPFSDIKGGSSSENYTFSGNIEFQTGGWSETLKITGGAPNIYFRDATVGAFVGVNGDSFYVLSDRDANGNYESPHALNLRMDINTGYLFGGEIVTSGTTQTISGNKTWTGITYPTSLRFKDADSEARLDITSKWLRYRFGGGPSDTNGISLSHYDTTNMELSRHGWARFYNWVEVIDDEGLRIYSKTNDAAEGAQITFSDQSTRQQHGWLRFFHGNSKNNYGKGAAFKLGSSESLIFEVDGEITSQDTEATSDMRLKSNRKRMTNTLELLDLIDGWTYYQERLEKQKAGIIAQEIQQVLPEAVSEDSDGYLKVSIMGVVGFLVSALKELKTEVRGGR